MYKDKVGKNQHLGTIIEITDSSMQHQWMLKLINEEKLKLLSAI